MANEFTIEGYYLYRQDDEQVYIFHPNRVDDYYYRINKFIVNLYFENIKIYYISRDKRYATGNKLIFLNKELKSANPGQSKIYSQNISNVYIPYPLPDPILELERQLLLNKYLLEKG